MSTDLTFVTNEPGITRDRIHGKAEWGGRALEIVDTGGLLPDDKALIPQEILRQAHVAIKKAASAHNPKSRSMSSPPVSRDRVYRVARERRKVVRPRSRASADRA